jgi:hypothetical protein
MKNNIWISTFAILVFVLMAGSCKKEGPKTGLYIGKSYLEGTIAYILQPGDPGYVNGVPHGLVAAPYDQSAGIQWCNGASAYTKTNAFDTAIGSGMLNTQRILTSQHPGSYAASLCSKLALGDSGGWYLPSLDELDKMYVNQAAIGGFAGDYYWSSSEDTVTQAWLIYFPTGFEDNGYKDWTGGRVRAVRSF